MSSTRLSQFGLSTVALPPAPAVLAAAATQGGNCSTLQRFFYGREGPAARLQPAAGLSGALLSDTDEGAPHKTRAPPLTASPKASLVSTACSKATSHSACPSSRAPSLPALPQPGGERKSTDGSWLPSWRRIAGTACTDRGTLYSSQVEGARVHSSVTSS